MYTTLPAPFLVAHSVYALANTATTPNITSIWSLAYGNIAPFAAMCLAIECIALFLYNELGLAVNSILDTGGKKIVYRCRLPNYKQEACCAVIISAQPPTLASALWTLWGLRTIFCP